MMFESPTYNARVADIRASLVKPDPTEASHFVHKPNVMLAPILAERRNWFFRKKQNEEMGIALLGDLAFWSKEQQDFIIELKGAICDGASVPQFLWWLFPPFGKGRGAYYALAAVIHDKLCRLGEKGLSPYDYKQAAAIFREAMVALNVRPRIYKTMSRSVILFGPRFKAKESYEIAGALRNA